MEHFKLEKCEKWQFKDNKILFLVFVDFLFKLKIHICVKNGQIEIMFVL